MRRLKYGCLGLLGGFISFFFLPGLLFQIFAHQEWEARRNDLPDLGVMLVSLVGCLVAGLLIGLVLGWRQRPES